MYVNERMGRGNFTKGTLTGTTAVIAMDEAPLPCTIYTASTTGASYPTVDVSIDGGTTWFSLSYQSSHTGTNPSAFYNLDFPVSHIRITGVVGDTYLVR